MDGVSMGKAFLPLPLTEVKPRSGEEIGHFHAAVPVGFWLHNSNFALRGFCVARGWCGGAGRGKRIPRALPVPGQRRPGEFFVNNELIIVN